MAANTIGFVGDKKGKSAQAVDKLFSPEFRNRLDGTVTFDSLDIDSMKSVVDKMIIELEVQLSEKKVNIRLQAAAREWLAKKGYDPDYGARPLRRLIMKEIGDTLSEEILFGQLVKGGTATIALEKDALTFSYND